MPSTLFDVFRPDPDDLLRHVSRNIDDAMLAEIAAADYGFGHQEHFSKLRLIRDAGEFDTPLRWEPLEVLRLVRWSKPDSPHAESHARGERGHWKRAFVCATLLRAAPDAANPDDLRWGCSETLILLVDSLRSLNAGFDRPASRSIAWLISRFTEVTDVEELGLLGVGLLWFAMHCRPRVGDETIVALAEWIDAQERSNNETLSSEPWLLGNNYHYRFRPAWNELGRALGMLDLGDRSTAVNDWIKLIGSSLAEPISDASV